MAEILQILRLAVPVTGGVVQVEGLPELAGGLGRAAQAQVDPAQVVPRVALRRSEPISRTTVRASWDQAVASS